MEFSEIRQRLLALETSNVADADKSIRVLHSSIRPVVDNLPMIGVARTVNCHEDFLTVIKALGDSMPDEVLVINAHDSSAASTGELFATEAKRRGLAGIVIDGACRDLAGIRKLKFPVYARSSSPLAGTTKRIFDTQVAIQCGGITVNPGDILFGDDDGVIVASVDEFAELIPIAEQIRQTEVELSRRMAQGTSLLDMLNFAEHWQNTEAGVPSKLAFKLNNK
jgi:4-hydroxy-4-methyl-2-oxoglutarate aldolase